MKIKVRILGNVRHFFVNGVLVERWFKSDGGWLQYKDGDFVKFRQKIKDIKSDILQEYS